MTADANADVAFLQQLQKQLPLSKSQIAAAKKCIARLSAAQLQAAGLGPPSTPPPPPEAVHTLPARERLKRLQDYISAFTYNFMSKYQYNVHKRRPFNQIMNTARDITRECLPIKCIEATFLGIFLTCRYAEWDRYPMGFKTRIHGQPGAYRHIVLIVRDRQSQQWGALGISRRDNLMYKPLVYTSLSSLVTDYKESYAKWRHYIVKVRLGLPCDHNLHSSSEITWRYCNVNTNLKKWDQVSALLDDYADNARALRAKYKASGERRRLSSFGRKAAPAPDSAEDSDGDDALSTPSECSDSEDELYARIARQRSKR